LILFDAESESLIFSLTLNNSSCN